MTVVQRETPVTPPVRWAGSKRALVPTLLELMPEDFGRYIEPFAGSACLFFASNPRNAILSDFNDALIGAYQGIKENCSEVSALLSSFDPDGNDYYEIRDSFNQTADRLERAAYFIYLNRFCFNGVFRTNRAGAYNVPRGSRTGRMPDMAELERVAARLQGADLRVSDFALTMREAREGDFLYVDPPYVTTHRDTYGEYGYGSFSDMADYDRMRQELAGATERGVKVMLSFGSRSPFDDILESWAVVEFSTRRRISADVTSRATRYSEIIATNY